MTYEAIVGLWIDKGPFQPVSRYYRISYLNRNICLSPGQTGTEAVYPVVARQVDWLAGDRVPLLQQNVSSLPLALEQPDTDADA